MFTARNNDAPFPGAEAGKVADNIVHFLRGIIILGVLVIGIPLSIVITFSRSAILRVCNDTTVRIVELNPNLYKVSEYPLLESEDTPCYAIVGSYEEAEDWLLERGYHCRTITTRYTGDWHKYNNTADKTFAVKGEPGSPYESVIMLITDYGDDYPHFVPFRYEEKEQPVDFARFHRTPIDVNTAFELGYYSTHFDDPGWFLRCTGAVEWPRGIYYAETYEEENEEIAKQAAFTTANREASLEDKLNLIDF